MHRRRSWVFAAVLLCAVPDGASAVPAQATSTPSSTRRDSPVVEGAVLTGVVLEGDSPVEAATVVLHHMGPGGTGAVESTTAGAGGEFQFLLSAGLPTVPDADIVGARDWLTRLVSPLNASAADLSTGYRWFIPQTKNLANLIATNLNGAVAMLAGPNWHTLLWGGSMAMTRETYDDLDVPELLRGSLNDDLQISQHARRKGKRLFFVRSLFCPTTPLFPAGRWITSSKQRAVHSIMSMRTNRVPCLVAC